jgi:hypothetical protein
MQSACAVLSSLPAPLYKFSTLSNKRYDSRKTIIEPKMCGQIFSTNLNETFFILRRTERDIIKNVYVFM